MSNLGLSQFKTVCAHAIFLLLNGVFGHTNFAQWGHLFCTKWFLTKMEIEWSSEMKKTP
jgi:hypothetical protein